MKVLKIFFNPVRLIRLIYETSLINYVYNKKKRNICDV